MGKYFLCALGEPEGKTEPQRINHVYKLLRNSKQGNIYAVSHCTAFSTTASHGRIWAFFHDILFSVMLTPIEEEKRKTRPLSPVQPSEAFSVHTIRNNQHRYLALNVHGLKSYLFVNVCPRIIHLHHKIASIHSSSPVRADTRPSTIGGVFRVRL